MKNQINGNVLKREIGLFPAIIIVIANMIGTGIFTTSGFIAGELGSSATLLACWLAGGLFALSGALCYGELGAMFPGAGGEYVFIRESWGKAAAFLSGWISLIVGFSAPIAAAAIAFGSYFLKLLPFVHEWNYILSAGKFEIIKITPVVLCGIIIIILITVAHYNSISTGIRVQNALTIFKVLFIAVFIVSGSIWGNGSLNHFNDSFSISNLFKDRFAIALIFVSFAYSGWNAAAYLGGEIKNPQKNIPLALFSGTLLVTCLYILLNILYVYALGTKGMAGRIETGADTATALFGSGISFLFTAAISFGLMSVLSAMIMSGPRVYYAMSRDGIFFKLFGKVNPLHRTPASSIFLQAAVSILMVLTASFDMLLLFVGFTLSIFSSLAVAGMIKLRFTKPELTRKYKTFGYPLIPLIFILGNIWIISFSIYTRPLASLSGLAVIAAGLILYIFIRQKAE